METGICVCWAGSLLQYVAACCSTLQLVVVHCSVLQCLVVSVLQGASGCCGVLQGVAVRCSVLQKVAGDIQNGRYHDVFGTARMSLCFSHYGLLPPL